MRRVTILLLAAVVGLTACGTVRDSRINPLNWFGNSREEPVQAAPEKAVNPLIPEQSSGGLFKRQKELDSIYRGVPVNVVRDLVIERVPGGAIIRVTGVSQFQNVYDVRLTPVDENEEPVEGVLEYRLEAIIPEKPISGGDERLRTIVAARTMTDNELELVRQIRVIGQENARVVARR
ncbi:MAG: hypothetical protein ABJM43_07025 [Paracoccaceae bacterium]